MLKTNSKAFTESVKTEICRLFDPEYTDIAAAAENYTFPEISNCILREFIRVMACDFARYPKKTYSEHFVYFCETLPGIFDVPCIAHGNAVDYVGDMLQQTETERNKYTETQAYTLFCNIAFRLMLRECPSFFGNAAAAANKYKR